MSVAQIVSVPDDLAGAVHLDNAIVPGIGDQNIAIRQWVGGMWNVESTGISPDQVALEIGDKT